MKTNAIRMFLVALVLATPMAVWPSFAGDDYRFHLRGGYFFGPGPIRPDTALPDGEIAGVSFDTARLRGEAKFRPADKPLSDGKTRVNANIDAGRLGIGENKQAKSFWLTAVDGGPNHGTEQYEFDAALNFVWKVDLALDPGFPEGIIRVDNFVLTTGWVQVPRSLQTARGQPGGYDRAGSLMSGEYIAGRVGDFDRDGYLDGILVAQANVPLESDMLPGAPVANLRGFASTIPVDPIAAAEMTLAGVYNMKPMVERLIAAPDLVKLKAVLADIGERIDAASRNCEDAFLKADRKDKDRLQEIRWRIEAARKMFFIPWAFLESYPSPSGKPSESIKDATQRGFDILGDVLPRLKAMRQGAAATEKRS
ncbi:MAG: hypothetical protein LW847_11290 [Burkholderiales bacterium]|jgi:hypothetical protein|nr:hypothetical protein [Burkholderiales bacterium]